LDPSGRDVDRNFNNISLSFDSLNVRQQIEITSNGEDHLLLLYILTDGCSRIIRISNRSRDQDKKAIAELREPSIKRYRSLNQRKIDQSDINKDHEEQAPEVQQKIAYTMSVNVNEILVSFVAKITEREENVMKSMRKEIATFTV
jgi:hypothetical protein